MPVHVLDALLAVETRRASGDYDRLDELARARVSARLAAAEHASDGMRKMFYYEEAAQLARTLGANDLAERAVRAMQSIGDDNMGWATHSMDITLPRWIVESEVRRYTGARDWRTGLARWLQSSPPTGKYQANRKQTIDSLQGTVFWRIFPVRRFSHGMPQRSGGRDDEEALDSEIRRTEQFNLVTHGGMLTEALSRIGELPGAPTRSELATFLIETFDVEAQLADALSHGIALYWAGDFIAAATVVTPTVETAARALLRESNFALYKVETGRTIGQFLQLGSMMAMLDEQLLDLDWSRFLTNLLLPPGYNLRNELAHGFALNASPLQAAMLIRAAGLLILMADAGSVRDDRRRPPVVLDTVHNGRRVGRRLRAAWLAAKVAYWHASIDYRPVVRKRPPIGSDLDAPHESPPESRVHPPGLSS